jgi:hypothetical protein
LRLGRSMTGAVRSWWLSCSGWTSRFVAWRSAWRAGTSGSVGSSASWIVPRGTPPLRRALIRPLRRRAARDPSGRKRGAQDGHEGYGRPLLPAWAVDEVIEHWPGCWRCGHVFSSEERRAVGEPARHQGRRAPADHGAGGRIVASGCAARRVAGAVVASYRRRLPRAPSGLACKRPWRRCRCATVSRAMMPWSSAESCSARGSALAAWTRSSPE